MQLPTRKQITFFIGYGLFWLLLIGVVILAGYLFVKLLLLIASSLL